MGVGAASGFAAALVGVIYLVKYRNLRLRFTSWRPRFTVDAREEVREELADTEATATRAS